MNTFTCALWNGATAQSQQRGQQPWAVGTSHCCSEVHGSQLASKIRNSWFTMKGLLIFGLRKYSSEYLRLLFMAGITENLNFEVL